MKTRHFINVGFENIPFKYSLLIIVLLTVVIRIFAFRPVVLGFHDEILYGYFVKTFIGNGFAGIQAIVNNYETDAILNNGPLPFRILYIIFGAIMCKIFGPLTVYNLALLSCISGMGVVILSYLLFKCWFSPLIAFLSSILVALSPLAMALSKRALADSFFTLFIIASIYFYQKYLMTKKNRYYFYFGLTIMFGILTKETMIALFPIFIIIAFYQKTENNVNAWPMALVLSIVSVVYFLICSTLSGGCGKFLEISFFYSNMQSLIEFAVKNQKGPWFKYFIDLMLISPITCILAIVGFMSRTNNNKNKEDKNTIGFYIIAGLGIFTLMPILNVRFVLFVDILVRPLTILGIFCIASKTRSIKFKCAALVAIILLVFGVEIYQYYRIFIKADVYDPVTANLICANGFVN